MKRYSLLFFILAVTLATGADPNSLSESLHRDLKQNQDGIIKVVAGQPIPVREGIVVVEAEVTRKERYLVWEKDGVSHRIYDWKTDAAKEWLATPFDNILITYDFVREIAVPVKTRLPVEAVLELSDREKGEITVRLIDHRVEKVSLHKKAP